MLWRWSVFSYSRSSIQMLILHLKGFSGLKSFEDKVEIATRATNYKNCPYRSRQLIVKLYAFQYIGSQVLWAYTSIIRQSTLPSVYLLFTSLKDKNIWPYDRRLVEIIIQNKLFGKPLCKQLRPVIVYVVY